MKVGKEIGLLAKELNICDEYFAEMIKYGDIKPLCEMYFKGSDWAMEHDFPKLETLRQFRGNSEKHGLFTDFKGAAETDKSAFFGDSDAEIVAKDFVVKEVYVRHDSKLKLTAKDHSIVIVNVLDNAKLEVNSEKETNVTIYSYGVLQNITTSGEGNIQVLKADFN